MKNENISVIQQHLNNNFVFAPSAISHDAETNRANFIRYCKEYIMVFGADLNWDSWRWPGIGAFVKDGVACVERTNSPRADKLLDPAFIDFAKACLRYMGKEPVSNTVHYQRLSALRALEAGLLERKQSADPSGIDIEVFDHALQVISGSSKSRSHKYAVGQKLEHLAYLFTNLNLISHRNDVSSFRNSIQKEKQLLRMVGYEGDEYRKKKLPDINALHALGSIFAKGWPPDKLKDSEKKLWLPPSNILNLRDIYFTSVVAILMSFPCRISEVHLLKINLEYDENDSVGESQYGLRWHSLKNFGEKISWVPKVWVPVAKEAVRRLMALTEKSRHLAKYIEQQLEELKKNPNAPLLFIVIQIALKYQMINHLQ
jgi:hypothetical protein